MTEFSSIFDEFESDLATSEYVDVRKTPEWALFIDAISDANRDLVLYHGEEPTNEDVMDRIIEITQSITETLPSFVNQPCQALGRAYRAHQEEHDVEPVILDSSKLRFYRPDIGYIAGQWRVVLRLYNARRTDDLEYGFYYVLPEDPCLMDLRVKPRDEDEIGVDDAVESLHNYVVASRQFVTSAEFTELSAQQQRTRLEQFIGDLNESLPGELQDIDIPVECSRYYIEFDDDANTTPPHRTYCEDGRVTLVGKMTGFEYPELQQIAPGQKLELKDFTMNGGAACMQLRNDESRLTYHILPQSIVEVA